MLTCSNVFFKNKEAYKAAKRYIINQGGTSSTKTFSILQLLVLIVLKNPYIQIDIVGQSVPHLKQGVLRDIVNVCKQLNINFNKFYNITDKVFKPNGTIQFLSFDNLGKAHGGRRDILFLNEANHIEYAIVQQLMMRTKQAIFIDFNPSNKFWAYYELLENEENAKDCALIHSTYKDNLWLEQSIIDYLESRRGDGTNNFWRVYGLGEIGIHEGLVFKNLEERTITDDEIRQFDSIMEGIDWGYSVNGLFAWTQTHYDKAHRTLYIIDEVTGSKLSDERAMDMVSARNCTLATIIADSAEPKSCDLWSSKGFNIEKCQKHAGSREKRYHWLETLDAIIIDKVRCPVAYKEFSEMEYLTDRNGVIKDMYPKVNEHCIDSASYSRQYDINENY